MSVLRTPLVGIFGNGEIGIDHYPGSETKYKASDTLSLINKIICRIFVLSRKFYSLDRYFMLGLCCRFSLTN
jgi:hypothetical protein